MITIKNILSSGFFSYCFSKLTFSTTFQNLHTPTPSKISYAYESDLLAQKQNTYIQSNATSSWPSYHFIFWLKNKKLHKIGFFSKKNYKDQYDVEKIAKSRPRFSTLNHQDTIKQIFLKFNSIQFLINIRRT